MGGGAYCSVGGPGGVGVSLQELPLGERLRFGLLSPCMVLISPWRSVGV